MATNNEYIFEESKTVQNVLESADRLFQMSEEFDARTNQELYRLLAGIYALYRSAKENGYSQEAVALMADKLEKAKVKVQENTPALTVFVRYVYRTDRKRAYTYSQALSYAEKKAVPAEDLPSFIDAQGGVTKCKEANGAKADASAKAKEKTLGEMLESFKHEKPFQSFKLKDGQYDKSKDPGVALIVAKIDAEGQLHLFNILQDVGVGLLKQVLSKTQDEGSTVAAPSDSFDLISEAVQEALAV